nr:immunoglobulin heavy chain junction region [Macaca mulatta]MOW76819.1 immunoglobulin heavy chain junction region [Macaca mulatta]MOW76976.1 immunoglobulin heavy chain junction region [Macaca mulatta]MOW77029.1 immunoglobulin heavy chain junction region [Macaca mulatta]MOW77136.1 immunoglobulin heavy chain junction region [Macaca mulatta]
CARGSHYAYSNYVGDFDFW